tara:strand:+ start:2442 stop:2699 length:258 start_codon:yes stop_codon:yes gene_type:complete
MAYKFDKVVIKRENFKGYTGNAPVNETEYNLRKDEMFSGTAPTWTEIETEMDNLVDRKTLKSNAKTKLMAGEPLTEDEANVMVGL